MSRSIVRAAPFWQQTKTTPARLAGTWPDLVGRAGAALPEGDLVRPYDRAAAPRRALWGRRAAAPP